MILTGFFCAFVCAVAPGQVIVGPGNRVTINGAQVGQYIDNESPTQAQEIAATPGLRLAGVAPGGYTRLPRLPGAIRLREFYPVGFSWRIEPGDGYILQGNFRWPGERSPTRAERRRMWCMALARHPLMILWYGYTPAVAMQAQEFAAKPCPG